MNELIKQINDLTQRIKKLEKEKVTRQMPTNEKNSVIRSVIDKTEYIGNFAGVASPTLESKPSVLQMRLNGKLWNVPMNANILQGAGVPSFTAPTGTLYLRTDGSSTSTRAYIASLSAGVTTWNAVTTLS